MVGRRRLAGVAQVACLLAITAATAAQACELLLAEHRSGRELLRLPLAAQAPEIRIAFEHSVLGTTVVDHYRFGATARLVEERFEGQGYGLPHRAGAGEVLTRAGAAWRLQLDREVHPLVVRPLPAQRMRLLLGNSEWLLGELSLLAIEFSVHGCPVAAAS